MTPTESPARGQPASRTMQEANTSRRVFAVSGLIVTPIAFAAALIVALSVGWQNAVLIALVFAGFAAAFFYGLNRLAVAIRRDERRALSAASRGRRRSRGARTA